jgi:hypothetical protein
LEIIELAEAILARQEETNASILEIFKTGSQVFLNRDKDKDFVVVCTGYGQRMSRNKIEHEGKKYDFYIYDEEALARSLDFSSSGSYFEREMEEKLYNYFRDSNIKQTVYGSPSIQWSMMDHREKYISHIRDMFNSRRDPVGRPTYHFITDPWMVGKIFVHYYVILRMYENNSAEITPDIIRDVSLLYGRDPRSGPIIDWVRERLREVEL